MKRISIVIVGVIFVGIFISIHAVAAEKRVSTVTYYLEGTTNGKGRFDLPHGLTGVKKIVGVTVAIQHKVNRSWYTIHTSEDVKSRIAWNDKMVSGVIEHPDYANQPVRILIFTIFSPK